MHLRNTYYVLRHGRAVSNVDKICSSWPETFDNPLTLEGRQQVREALQILKEKNIDYIFASDVLRARQTAQIVGEELDLPVTLDERLREFNFGVYNGSSLEKYNKDYPDMLNRFWIKPKDGEN